MFSFSLRLPRAHRIRWRTSMPATGTSQATSTRDPGLGGALPTPALLEAMLRTSEHVSDLVFSPGRPPQVEVHGQLIAVRVPGLGTLTADYTRRIAGDLIGSNKQAITMLREQGSCDISYGVPGVARFRVNIFIQRGSVAIVMRVIPTEIPGFEALRLPSHLSQIANLREGIVLVTGGRGAGKSSTLASLLDRINEQQTCHIITIEDPIEFLHNHKRATIHQRELHSDTPSFAQALRATMRQAPRVILISEICDRETMEIVLEAAETGHLVLSSLNTIDTAKTVERITGWFSTAEHESVRRRLSKVIRYLLCQRLLPRTDGRGRVAVLEVLRANPRVRQCLEYGEQSGQTLMDALKDPASEGSQCFDDEIEKLIRARVVDAETGLAYATNPQQLRKALEH
jgi:twitching motility protein PilT